MPVTFRTDVHADILMFGGIAVQLLKLMGHSGTVPGALLAEDVPAALERLRAALAAQPGAALPGARRQQETPDKAAASSPAAPPAVQKTL